MRHKKSAKKAFGCKRNNIACKMFNILKWNGYFEKAEMHGFQMAITGTAKSDLEDQK